MEDRKPDMWYKPVTHVVCFTIICKTICMNTLHGLGKPIRRQKYLTTHSNLTVYTIINDDKLGGKKKRNISCQHLPACTLVTAMYYFGDAQTARQNGSLEYDKLTNSS